MSTEAAPARQDAPAVNGATSAAHELVAEVERRLEAIETLADKQAREQANGLAQALLELYGTGLERIVDEVAARDDGTLAAAFAGDELVSHLLLLHGLHPVALADRVRGALAEVRPYLDSHGGDVELVSVQEGIVRLAMQGSCSGCPSSTMTLKLAIEDAIRKAAPEIEEVVALQAPAPLLTIESAAPAPLLQIQPMSPAGDVQASWTPATDVADLASDGTRMQAVAGQEILFLNSGDRLYAYRPRCPACSASLADATLAGAQLACRGCDTRFDVRSAGRGVAAADLQLEPVPLLQGPDGVVKVALPVAA